MGVLVEAISVLVRRATLEASYPGGVPQYDTDCPNGTFCMDAHLTRVGFMLPSDVQAYVARLERSGLRFMEGGKCKDIAIVDQLRGSTMPCDWVLVGTHPKGFTVAWYPGTSPTPMVCPNGWSLEQIRELHFSGDTEAPGRLLRLSESEGLISYLDMKTGMEVCVGRAMPEQL